MAGCGSGGNDPYAALAKSNEQNIQRLANLYISYQMANRWQGPRDEEDFKNFLRGYSEKKLTRIGIDPNAIDDIFINERDGEPFKIRYGVQGSSRGSSELVIFEAVGVDGIRLVGGLDSIQHEVGPDEYDDMWAGTAKPVSSLPTAPPVPN